MSIALTGLCRVHSFESATALCRRCGLEYCESCVVYPFGEKKPLCKECAMASGGVRNHTALPAMNPRLVKKRAKAFEAVATSNAAAPMAEPVVPDIVDPTIETPAPDPGVLVPDDLDTVYEGYQEPPPLPSAAIPPPATQPHPTDDGAAPAVDWNNPFG